MTAIPSRRAVLAGAVALPALSLPAIAARGDDPMIAAVRRYRQLEKDWYALCVKLDKAEASIEECRPTALVTWRNYMIGGSEIDYRRETLLQEGKLKPATVEREYRKAKVREQELRQAQKDWDKRHGLDELRQAMEHSQSELGEAAEAIGRLTPTTLAGAAAAIECVVCDLTDTDPEDWQLAALKNVTAFLRAAVV